MKRCRCVLIVLAACVLFVVAGRALATDRVDGTRRSAGQHAKDAAAEASTRSNDLGLTNETTNHGWVRDALGASLGAATVDLVALLCGAFLVGVALEPAVGRRRAWPSVLRRGPPLPYVR